MLCPFGEEAAYAATRELLARPDRPTAVFASDSVIALGVLRAISDAGLTVPTDVAVVAGDEPAWSRVTTPPLSTVTQPVAALGRAALELVTRRLADPTSPCTDVVLPTTFQARASTAGGPYAPSPHQDPHPRLLALVSVCACSNARRRTRSSNERDA